METLLRNYYNRRIKLQPAVNPTRYLRKMGPTHAKAQADVHFSVQCDPMHRGMTILFQGTIFVTFRN